MGTTSGHTSQDEPSCAGKVQPIEGTNFPSNHPFSCFQLTFSDVALFVNVPRCANAQGFSHGVERGRLHGTGASHIGLIGQMQAVVFWCQILCQCVEAAYEPYPYSCAAPNVEPQPYYGPSYFLVPYPSLTVSYDPYWPTRITPTSHPLFPVTYASRFRGEVRDGNCLMIYE